MSVAVIYGLEWIRGLGLPLVSGISGDVAVNDIKGIARRFSEFIGEEMAEALYRVLDDALRNEVAKALTTDNLEQDVHSLVEKFWARIALPEAELTQQILSSTDRSTLEEFINIEEELGTALAKLVRRSGYKFAEDLVYGLSVLLDRDRWVIEKISELGVDGLIKRILDRDPKAFVEFTTYTAYLTFTWVASTSPVLGIVKDYKVENRDKLAHWCKHYAAEVEDYIDTLDILVKDDVYRELLKLGAVKR